MAVKEEQAQAEALRRAANKLAEAAKADDPYQAFMYCVVAFDGMPPELEDGPIDDAIRHLYDKREWQDNQAGLRWLAQAAQLRLLVEEIMVSENAMLRTDALGRMALTWWKEAQHG